MTIMQMLLAGGGGPSFEFVSASASDVDNVSLLSIPEPVPGYAAGDLLLLLTASGNDQPFSTISDSFVERVSQSAVRGTAVYSKISDGAEGSVSITFGGDAKHSGGVVQFSDAIYAVGGTGANGSVAIPSRTFPAGGGATVVLEQRNESSGNSSNAPNLISGFTSLATGAADRRGWRLQYRLEAAGASAAATSALSSGNTVTWAQVEAG